MCAVMLAIGGTAAVAVALWPDRADHGGATTTSVGSTPKSVIQSAGICADMILREG